MAADTPIHLRGLVGRAADREVFVGFAPARLLHALSFADVLDEDAGTGYQRRFSAEHSLDFRRYIRRPGSTTIPLTFNLRPRDAAAWAVVRDDAGAARDDGASARLEIAADAGRVFAQVDCQHRLGHIGDLDLPLPFMTFLGLDARAELEIFNVINGKARGLNSSLLDYHDARLAGNLGRERPELLVALHLNDAPESPWYKQLDLGGTSTSGLARRASLRTMQKAARRFLSASGVLASGTTPPEAARLVLEYWIAVREVLRAQWADPRRHFLTKGVGVYALMGMLADFCREWAAAGRSPATSTRRDFASYLGDFASDIDWSSAGPLQGLGGESGARAALELLRAARRASPDARYLTLDGGSQAHRGPSADGELLRPTMPGTRRRPIRRLAPASR